MARAASIRRTGCAATLAAALVVTLAAPAALVAQGTTPGAGGVRDMIRQRSAADSARGATTGQPPPMANPSTGSYVPPSAALLADTTLGTAGRVPGLPLRFGDGYARVRRRVEMLPADAPEAGPGEAVLAGPLRFFGVDGAARITFDGQGLARVAWRTHSLSPNQRDYVEDQLRRAGLRRECQRFDDRMRECDWVGDLTVHVKSDTSGMTAETVRPGETASRTLHLLSDAQRDSIAEAARVRQFLADPSPILADTLTIDPAATPGRYSPPVLQQAFPPEYPDALRERGITGIVRVLALVGTNGRVAYARPDDGPRDLRPIAHDTVMRYRFNGYVDAGRPVRFWVWVPVRFGV